MTVLPDLHGRTALVTGGGRGIGRATCKALAECGARVIVSARTHSQIATVSEEIIRAGGQSQAIVADVSQVKDVQLLYETVGNVDILINNAGIIGPISPVAYTHPDAWLDNINVNLHAVFLTCRYALPGMIESGWGRIVNISSGAARGTTAGWGAYSAAKAGVEAFTSVLAREVEEAGIRVNAVRPGIVDTEMQVEIRGSSEEQFGRDNLERFRSYKDRGLLRKPEDPARLVLWLLSPEADSTTGQTLAIDDPEIAARIGLVPMGR